MSDLFYLQDSRSIVGSRAMFWRLGGGYTSNLDEAEPFTREAAVRQYECRETDLPWPVAYVRERAQIGVDCQYLELPAKRALSAATPDEAIYASYDSAWDGNCLIWHGDNGPTSNLADATVWPRHGASVCEAVGAIVWPKSYIDQHSRPVVRAMMLDHKQALRSVKLKLPKFKPQRFRRERFNCHGCGRFLSERQRFENCQNCEASNAP